MRDWSNSRATAQKGHSHNDDKEGRRTTGLALATGANRVTRMTWQDLDDVISSC